MSKPRYTCFNCGSGHQIAAIQSKQIRRRRFICPERRCWEAYWNEADQIPLASKGRKKTP